MDLLSRWCDAVELLGGNRAVARASGAELLAAYGTAQRSYHDLTHVAQVVRDVEELAEDLWLSQEDRDVVVLAAFAHDVVYEGAPGQDEAASAAWVRRRLTEAGVEEADRVADLVLATADHSPAPDDLPAAVLMDADLAVLGSPPPDYDRYVAQVRREYAAFDDATWALGRSTILRALLAKPYVYGSAPARELWEAAARANLERELASYA